MQIGEGKESTLTLSTVMILSGEMSGVRSVSMIRKSSKKLWNDVYGIAGLIYKNQA